MKAAIGLPISAYMLSFAVFTLLAGGWAGRYGVCRLFAAGAARVTDGFHMSQTYCAMPRDGMLPLSRCIKRVSMVR